MVEDRRRLRHRGRHSSSSSTGGGGDDDTTTGGTSTATTAAATMMSAGSVGSPSSSSSSNPAGGVAKIIQHHGEDDEGEAEEGLLVDAVAGYVARKQQQQHIHRISSRVASCDLGQVRIHLPNNSNNNASSTASAGTPSSNSNFNSKPPPSPPSSSCLRAIKERYPAGGLRAFFESHPTRFRIHDDSGVNGGGGEGEEEEEEDDRGKAKKEPKKKKKNRRRNLDYAVSLVEQQQQQQQGGRAAKRNVTVAGRKATDARGGDSDGVNGSVSTRRRPDPSAPTPPPPQQQQPRKQAKKAPPSGNLEERLEAERRRRAEAEGDRDRLAMRLGEVEAEAEADRKRSNAELRRVEKLLNSERRHGADVERLWHEAEEEADRAAGLLRVDLEVARGQLEVERRTRKDTEAEQSKIQKLLHSERRHRQELERIWGEEKADGERSTRELRKELLFAQQVAKDEAQRRKRIETELDRVEKLLAEARDGSLAHSKIARQGREIQQLQEQLRRERQKNLAMAESAESNRPRAPSVGDYVSSRLPPSAATGPTTTPRILKRADFPVEPPSHQVSAASADVEPRYDGTLNEWVVGDNNKNSYNYSGSGGESDLERRDAEVAVVAASYGKDDLQVTSLPDEGPVQIKRLLAFPTQRNDGGGGASSQAAAAVELLLTLPKGYPSIALEVSASLAGGSAVRSDRDAQKRIAGAIPILAHLCRLEARARIGKEAVLPVLAVAEDWAANQSNQQRAGHSFGDNPDNEDVDFEHEELNVVRSVYSKEELQVIADPDGTDGCVRVVRILSLPVQAKSESISVRLQLLLQKDYQENNVPIGIEACLDGSVTSCSAAVHMCALDSLPGLVSLCRIEAHAMVGREAILHVLSAADEWVQSEWSGIQSKRFPLTDEECSDDACDPCVELCRMLIYSHHISEQDTIHFVKQTASKLKVGGLVKIGRPGFCLVEGLEENCESFLENLVAMHTKIRTGGARRGSSTATYCESGRSKSTGGKRLLPEKLCQLEGKDGTSDLRRHCDEAGLLEALDDSSKR